MRQTLLSRWISLPLLFGLCASIMLYLHPRVIAGAPFLALMLMGGYLYKENKITAYKTRLWTLFYQPWVWGVGALILWMGASCFFSQDLTVSLFAFGKLCAFATTFLGLSAGTKFISKDLVEKIAFGCFATFASLFMILTIDYATGLSLLNTLKPHTIYAHNHKAIIILFLFLPPSYYWLIHHRDRLKRNILLGGFFITFSLALSLGYACFTASLVILLLNALAWIASKFIPGRPLFRTLSFCIFIGGLTAPFLFFHLSPAQIRHWEATETMKRSHVHRLFIYKEASTQILRNPFRGYGLDACRAGGLQKDISFQHTPHSQYHSTVLSHHPHNFFMQWWLELGFFGAFLFIMLFSYAVSRLPCKTSQQTTQSLFLTIPLITIGLVSFGFSQSWILGSLVFFVFLYKTTQVE